MFFVVRKEEVVDTQFGITYAVDTDFHRKRLGLDENKPGDLLKAQKLYSAQILWNHGEISKKELKKLGMMVISKSRNKKNES